MKRNLKLGTTSSELGVHVKTPVAIPETTDV